MNRKELAREIYVTSQLSGFFKLRSGKVSREYFDKYLFESDPRLLKETARNMSKLIPVNTEILAGLEMGGKRGFCCQHTEARAYHRTAKAAA